MIIINLKNYKSGKELIKLSKKIEDKIPKSIICPSNIYLSDLIINTNLKIFSQHVDIVEKNPKRGTGFVTAKSLKSLGVKGSLLNHSEHRLNFEIIKKTINECNKNGLKVILCAASLSEVKKFKYLKPWAIAFEDPKLVSSGRSITDYSSHNVEKFSKLLKGSGINVYCGAGITDGRDYQNAKNLGCNGILISSAIANSSLKKIEKVLEDFKNG
jgi:triosephosphate isomerase (TIM)